MNDNQNNAQQSFNPEVQQQQPNNGGSKKGVAIASMVLGIVSIVLCCITYVTFPASIIAIILGAISMKDKSCKGFSLTGIITGVIGLILGIVYIVFLGAIIAAAGTAGIY